MFHTLSFCALGKIPQNTETNANAKKHDSYYSAAFIFPDFSEENQSFFLTNLFTQKYQCWISIACSNTRNKGSERNLKVEVQRICERSKQEKI